MARLLALGIAILGAVNVVAANYLLTTDSNNTAATAAFDSVNIGYWTDLATGEIATTPITSADNCYVNGGSSKKLVTSSYCKSFPGNELHLGVEDWSEPGGYMVVREGFACANFFWHKGCIYNGTGGAYYSLYNGTVTVDGDDSITHKIYFTTATPGSTSSWGLGIVSKLVGSNANTVIDVLLNDSATKDCCNKNSGDPLDAQIFFTGDNSNYAGRFRVTKFGHLAFGNSSKSAGWPASLVANKIELGANSRLAVANNITLSANCGITVSGKGAKLMAKAYSRTHNSTTNCTDYTLKMPITGDYGLTKDGDGRVTLAGAYTAGDLVVAAGTLVLAKEGSFKEGLKVTVKPGAKLVQCTYVSNIAVTCEEGGVYEKDITIEVPYDATTGETTPLDFSDIASDLLPVGLQLSESIQLPCHDGKRLDVAKVPTSVTVEDFKDMTVKTDGLPKTSFEIEDRGADGRMLVLVARPVVVSLADFAYDNGKGPGLVGVATNWSNGAAAQAGYDYYVTHFVDGFRNVFAGDSVTMHYTGTKYYALRSENSYVGAATIYPGIQFHPNMGGTTDYYFTGSVCVPDDGSGKYVTFESAWANGAKMRMETHLNVPLSGDGPVRILSTDYRARNFWLSGDNSQFAGKFRVEASGTGDGAPSVVTSTVVHVAEAVSLGGPCAAFNAASISIANYSMVSPDKSMTLEAENRGITVDSNGGFLVEEGLTLTVKEPLVVNGTLYKKGAGTLALGGDVSFGAKGKALQVLAGAVTPLADVAVAGFDTTFADGTSVVLDPTAETVDGFTGTVAAAGAVSVVLDVSKATRGTTYALPVCTLASDAADLTSVFVAAHVRGFTTKVEKVTLGDGRVRYQLKAEPKGLCLIFR